jgi:hypothetical protein
LRSRNDASMMGLGTRNECMVVQVWGFLVRGSAQAPDPRDKRDRLG